MYARHTSCQGEGKAVTFQQGKMFASKIGKGWRLPTYWEVEGASDYVMKIMAKGIPESAGKYGGGGWNCGGDAVWTSTGVTNEPNLVVYARCTGITTGNAIKNVSAYMHGDRKTYLILVK